MTIKNLLLEATEKLSNFSSARLDAELLLCYILQKDRVFLMTHSEEKVLLIQLRKFHYLISKRKNGLPLAYILGKKEFYDLDFKVNKYVLIPRPDTEILVESLISYLTSEDLLVDVGTGSGCIPISVLKNKKGIKSAAIDISKKALRVAEENAMAHAVGDRVDFFCSDLFQSVPLELFKEKNVVISANLPYVPQNKEVNSEASFEPSLALYAKNNGLELYQKLFDQLTSIKPKAIFLECYDFQVNDLSKYLKDYSQKKVKNMLGEARMVMFERIGQ